MSRILTNLGEEYGVKNGLVGGSFVVGLYNDATDQISETDDISDITTEPTGPAYDVQPAVLEAAKGGDDWQGQADVVISFDTSDSNETVDSYYVAKSFQAEETEDVASVLHLIGTGALSQSRDLSQIDVLNLPVGSVGVKLS